MDFESDSDELADFLQAAAEAGEITLDENVAPNSSEQQNGNGSQISVDKAKEAVKLAEEAYDSSDEEDLQNFFERKYTEYGRDINTMLKRKDAAHKDSVIGNEISKNLRKSNAPVANKPTPPPQTTRFSQQAPKPAEKQENFVTDPIFGLRLVQPLISSTMLRERMTGRKAVEIRYLHNHLQTADLTQDWCISGVIINKSPPQTSNGGAQYVIWKLSDLKGEIKSVALFLFKSAYKDLWKTAQGMVIAVLNPSVFSRKDNNGESSLSIDSAQRVMLLGRSKDYGICKSKKKNGEPCTAVVNLGICEFCVYHVKQEYGKMSGRSELQSATSGRGLQALRNKVLGKSEVFYGGKSFIAEQAKPSQKLKAQDQKRLMSLSESAASTPLAAAIAGARTNYLQKTERTGRVAATMESSSAQRMKDLERLKALNGGVAPSLSDQSLTAQSQSSLKPSTPSSAASLLASKPELGRSFDLSRTPSLSRDSFSFSVGKSFGSGGNRNDLAKARAAAVLQNKPIEKANPNHIKYRGTEAGKKRAHSAIDEVGNAQKKQKIEDEVEKFKNERIKHIISARSSHADLIAAHETSVQDQYFNKLERKEAMEEKMLSTTKVECKAVICLQCKYKAFAAAQRCKDEHHKFKVVDAEKRFFECEDCKNRTITLFRIPKVTCSNCQGSRWKRTGMIRDKSAIKSNEPLSIRGDEETFLGSVHNNGNINLCVASDD